MATQRDLGPIESIDLRGFLDAFSLDVNHFLAALKREKAIATGVEFVLLMAGEWRESLVRQPRALVLDVLHRDVEARSRLRAFFLSLGYRENPYTCAHALGEWHGISKSRRVCLVRGSLSQRVVHLVEFCNPVEEVVLSRVYGTMVGTYLTGAGRLVSLFPRMTFRERVCWCPRGVRRLSLPQLRRKYPDWSCSVGSAKEAGFEVTDVFRTTLDDCTWVLRYTGDGVLEEVRKPVRDRYVSLFSPLALLRANLFS
ncbi:hypothetical protein HD806DRAFT_516041 [Xylariaceae sp. AK1471]|nr:hypothetical protein HD806DRAFT_516041 [Xylariaceae sp. AK1471]